MGKVSYLSDNIIKHAEGELRGLREEEQGKKNAHELQPGTRQTCQARFPGDIVEKILAGTEVFHPEPRKTVALSGGGREV